MRKPRDSVNTRNRTGENIFRDLTVSNMGSAMTAGAVACFTFDNMAEAADVGAGNREGPLPPGLDPSLATGFPRVVDLLDRHAVRATFFVEGWNAIHHTYAVADIVRRGHELGMHGRVHAAGIRPRGFHAPGGRRPRLRRSCMSSPTSTTRASAIACRSSVY